MLMRATAAYQGYKGSMGYPRGLGASFIAITAGAILAFAITASTPGISLPAVGTILMIMGMIGFATCLYLDWMNRRSQQGYDQNFVGRNYEDGSTYQQPYQPQQGYQQRY
jgi:hypothetical protein